MLKKIINSLQQKALKTYEYLKKIASKIRPYGMYGLSIKDVGMRFFRAITAVSINSRAAAIAFNFFLAMFPAIIFVFTVIPYLPIENFSEMLMGFLSEILPNYAYETIATTVEDITTRRNAPLLSLGFLMSLYFAKNGFATLISTFNETTNATEKRSWFKVEVISLLFVVIITFLVTLTILLIMFYDTIFFYIQIYSDMSLITGFFLKIGHWALSISFFYFAVAILYYFSPTKKDRFRFFSLGAAVATALCIVLVLIFSYYINNFGTYNKLYGSIGTLIAMLVMIRLIALILVLGFEINSSIKRTQMEKKMNNE